MGLPYLGFRKVPAVFLIRLPVRKMGLTGTTGKDDLMTSNVRSKSEALEVGILESLCSLSSHPTGSLSVTQVCWTQASCRAFGLAAVLLPTMSSLLTIVFLEMPVTLDFI